MSTVTIEPIATSKSLLRFITAGSVDDGKSTLIGRLLYDTGNVYADQVAAIEASSRKRGMADIDLSLLTDGLEAEREQGITIDVAYRYFATATRKFIIGDAPGHEQYTRNMVTAGSTADLAIILVDARKGILPQTRRHSYLAHLLGIKQIVLAVNKMDAVDWQADVFAQIVAEYTGLAKSLGIADLCAIPLSALKGDNVVAASAAMPWYSGPTLMQHLETVPCKVPETEIGLRFPVQRVVRVMLGNGPAVAGVEEVAEFRGYQGTVAAGTVNVGDVVFALPAGKSATVRSIKLATRELSHASAGMAVVVELDQELDISRGDMLVAKAPPRQVKELEADVCWLAEEAMDPRRKYLLKHTTRKVRCLVSDLVHRVDVNTATRHENPAVVAMNDIVRIKLKLQQPLFTDTYRQSRVTGSFILVDETTLATVGAGVVV